MHGAHITCLYGLFEANLLAGTDFVRKGTISETRKYKCKLNYSHAVVGFLCKGTQLGSLSIGAPRVTEEIRATDPLWTDETIMEELANTLQLADRRLINYAASPASRVLPSNT